MNYKETAAAILEKVGGKNNVKSVGHCATRLRFVLKDNSIVDTDGIKNMKGIMGVVASGGQYQIVIGGEVTDVHRELLNMADFDNGTNESQDENGEKKGGVSTVLETIAGIFFPIVPALVGAGMLKALISLLNVLGVLNVESQTYLIIDFMSDAGFYFLPVILAVSAAHKFRCNQYLAAVLGGILLHPSFIQMVGSAKEAGEGIRFIGLPVSLVNYSSSVIPIILAVWFMSFVEPRVEKIVPKALRMIIAPLITLLIVGPVTLIVIGPLGNIAGEYLGMFFEMLNGVAPWMVPMLVGALTPLLVMCGMHYGLIPIGINMLATTGYDTVAGPGMLVSNIAQGGAALAVAVRAKDKEIKSLAASVGVSAVCGITEPAMYGISLRFKRPLAAAIVGGGVAGLFFGITGVGRYAQVAPGLFALPSYIGGNSMRVFYLACVGSAIAFIVSFVVSFILGIKETEASKKPEATETTEATETKEVLSEQITSPVSGKVISVEEINDPVFSQGLLGQGCAVVPEDGKVYAPVSGKIITLADTKHAIGIKAETGCEILIHIGMDTVELEGKYFEAHAKQDQFVERGDLLVTFDIEKLKAAGYDVTVPVVITNSQQYKTIRTATEETVKAGAKLLTVKA